MITISSEKSLFSQVLAMIILFILPSNLYQTPIPHKLGLFCRNLAFWTCDWQYLVCVVTWSQEDSFCFCRVLRNRTKCEHSVNSANSVKALYKRKVFPPPDVSARKPREGLALREEGEGGIELSEASHWSRPSFRSICSLRERLRCTARQTSPRFCDFQKLPLMESFAPFVCICGIISTPFPLSGDLCPLF